MLMVMMSFKLFLNLIIFFFLMSLNYQMIFF